MILRLHFQVRNGYFNYLFLPVDLFDVLFRGFLVKPTRLVIVIVLIVGFICFKLVG